MKHNLKIKLNPKFSTANIAVDENDTCSKWSHDMCLFTVTVWNMLRNADYDEKIARQNYKFRSLIEKKNCEMSLKRVSWILW